MTGTGTSVTVTARLRDGSVEVVRSCGDLECANWVWMDGVRLRHFHRVPS